MEYMVDELKKVPGAKNKTLFAGALEIDESVGELTLQQYHAKYRLPATRRIAPPPQPAPSGDGAPVMEFVERTLEVDPDVSNADLFAGAREIDPSVAELSARQFHAKYSLQVKARLARDAAAEPEAPPEPEAAPAEETVQPVALRDGPLHHRRDPLTHPLGRLVLLVPDRKQHDHDIGGRDLVHPLPADPGKRIQAQCRHSLARVPLEHRHGLAPLRPRVTA